MPQGSEGSGRADPEGRRQLLVVYQSRTGGTERLVEAATEGIRLALDSGGGASKCSVDTKHAFAATAEDVLAASAILIATPANFGYMSGAMKDFFERIYHPCLETTGRMPYSMIVKGDTDVDGAAASVQRIVKGMRWREVLDPLLVVGEVRPVHIDAAHELGATLAAGMEAGIF